MTDTNLKIELLKIIGSVFNDTVAVSKTHETQEDNRYVIVRTYSAGVFAGNIASRNGQEVVLRNARRLWKWAGAASLSQLAMDGVSDPDNCMFPVEIDRILLLQAIEVIDATAACKKSIDAVPVWTK